MLQACLNGARTKAFHPATPFTPQELAADAVHAVASGARELHFHPRDPEGLESLDPDHVAAAVRAVRAGAPGIPVGLSTHWDIPPGGAARHVPIARWRELPDYVSVNLVEADAPDVIALVLGQGIGVEAGLWSVADAERFFGLAEAPRCLRVLVEIDEQDTAEGMAVADAIIRRLAHSGLRLPILLHGYDATVWPIYRMALERGLDSRIGLEDGRDLPDGMLADGNAELLRAAVELARSAAVP